MNIMQLLLIFPLLETVSVVCDFILFGSSISHKICYVHITKITVT